MKYLECAGGEGGTRVEQYEKFVQDRIRSELERNGLSCEAEVCTSELNDSLNPCRSTNENDGNSGEDGQKPTASTYASEIDFEVHRNGGNLIQSSEVVLPPAVDESQFCGALDEMDPRSETRPAPVKDVLEKLNIEVHGAGWEDYNRTVLTQQEIFDLVISDPFQKAASAQSPEITPETRIELIQFVKKVLVPGGHVFLILPQLQMTDWLQVFENMEMKTEGVFLLLKDPENVQRVKGRSFQNLIEVAVVARKPGRHPTKFAMDVISPYTQLPRNTYKRKAPVIDHISPPASRLRFPGSKALVRTGEKSPALFWELMKTFCPAGGKVLDPFAATMTVGIASIQTGRSCVLLESDKKCFALAETRLREFANKYLEECEHPEPPDEFRTCDVYRIQKGDTTNLDAPNCDSMQVYAEDPQYERKGDECKSLSAERNSGDVGEAEESDSHSDIVPDRAMPAQSPEHSMQDGKEDRLPATCRTMVNSPATSDYRITERAKDLTTAARDLANTENASVIEYKASEITCEHANRKKRVKNAFHVGMMASADTEGRQQRKRKKTSRYAIR